MLPGKPGNRPDNDRQDPRSASFFTELKKRQVFESALAYGVIAWGATEILDGVITRFGWPDWLATLVVILFVVGFPVPMFLAWVFDWTPEGIHRDEPWTKMDRASVAAAITFLLAGTAGLFWLINPGGVARLEQIGVAVLPCRYQGPEEFLFRADGLAGAIDERLALLKKLRVPTFSSELRLSTHKPFTAELGRQAGVGWLVECRLRQEKKQWQIEASLVDVGTDRSDLVVALEGPDSELYGRLDPIAQTLASRLGVGAPPQDPLQRAWIERAVALKPSYAEPYRLLAEVLADAGNEEESEELMAVSRTLDPEPDPEARP